MKRSSEPEFAAEGGQRPRIWAVSITRLSRLISDVVPEFDARAEIHQVNLGFEEAAAHLHQPLQQGGCDVVIAAGSNGAYLRPRVPCPVVLVKASGFDLMQALARARKVSRHIGVITHQQELPTFGEFVDSFALGIEQRSFSTAEEAREHVAELVALGVGAIVGTGLVAELAEKAGIAGILLYSAQTIRAAFESALELARAAGSRPSKPPRGRERGSAARLLGDSKVMQAVRDKIVRYAPREHTVMILGETGTGKELVARAVHAASRRARGPFVAVNCAALADALLESELFGHDEGAFTGARRGGRAGLIETASGGTLFLDEIAEMPPALQTRLLRVLEEREVLRLGSARPRAVDIRVLVATHRDLRAALDEGRFRRDLYYRLDVLRIHLPRLADHAEDLPVLIDAMMAPARRAGHPWRLDAAVLAQLAAYSWPGNVRELRNLVERLLAHAEEDAQGHVIGLPALHRRAPELLAVAPLPEPVQSGAAITGARPSQAELLRVLKLAHGRRKVAAEMLGVSRTTLWRWLAEPPA